MCEGSGGYHRDGYCCQTKTSATIGLIIGIIFLIGLVVGGVFFVIWCINNQNKQNQRQQVQPLDATAVPMAQAVPVAQPVAQAVPMAQAVPVAQPVAQAQPYDPPPKY